MTRRHLSLFTPTYMDVVAVPGGSGGSCCFCNDWEESARSPRTRVSFSAGAPISPRNPNYPGNFQAAAFHHETDFRSGSGHQVPQKGGSYPPPQRGGQIPASAITRRKTSGTSQWNVSRGHEDVLDPCNSPSGSALQQQTATFPDICPPKAITSTKKKAQECIRYCKHKCMSFGMFSHAPPY